MHKAFLSSGDLPAIAGLKEEWRPPQVKRPRQIQIYSIRRLRASESIRVKTIFIGVPELRWGENPARSTLFAPRVAAFRLHLWQARQIRAQVSGRDKKLNRWLPHAEPEPVPQAGRSPSGFARPVL